MDDLLTILAVVMGLLLTGLAVAIAVDRARMGLRRAESEKLGRRQRRQELTRRLEQLESAIAEQKTAITNVERDLNKATQENDALRKQLDSTQHVFNYTVVPLESGDMYARVFRFTARHPGLGGDAREPDPVAQWDQGRIYAVAASNLTEARSTVDRLLPRHRGFTVVNAGEAATEGEREKA